MTETLCFSIYQEVPDHPVTVFNEARWTLNNRVELQTCIIGKSHRVISEREGQCFTEFISCDANEMPGNFLDRIHLQPGDTHDLEYRSGDFRYRVRIEHRPRLFRDVADFLQSIAAAPDVKVLSHVFQDPTGGRQSQSFTGLAVDSEGNRFYTVHTYPENGSSILSRTELCCPIFNTANL